MVYHGANPPYSYEQQGVYKGIFPDIFNEISKRTGLCFTYVSVSVARGKKLFEQGLIDIEPGMHPSWRADSVSPGLYTIDFAFSREIILSNQAKRLDSVRQLYGRVVGRVRGYIYQGLEAHFNQSPDDDKIIVYDNTSERELLAQLYHQRFEYILIGNTTSNYYRLLNPEYKKFHEVYEVSNLPVGMRLQASLAKLKVQLDEVLTTMIADGSIERIYANYDLPPSLK